MHPIVLSRSSGKESGALENEGESRSLLDTLLLLPLRMFGCRHRKYSRVFSRKNLEGELVHYVLCLSGCGRRLEYDWERMRLKQ